MDPSPSTDVTRAPPDRRGARRPARSRDASSDGSQPSQPPPRSFFPTPYRQKIFSSARSGSSTPHPPAARDLARRATPSPGQRRAEVAPAPLLRNRRRTGRAPTGPRGARSPRRRGERGSSAASCAGGPSRPRGLEQSVFATRLERGDPASPAPSSANTPVASLSTTSREASRRSRVARRVARRASSPRLYLGARSGWFSEGFLNPFVFAGAVRVLPPPARSSEKKVVARVGAVFFVSRDGSSVRPPDATASSGAPCASSAPQMSTPPLGSIAHRPPRAERLRRRFAEEATRRRDPPAGAPTPVPSDRGCPGSPCPSCLRCERLGPGLRDRPASAPLCPRTPRRARRSRGCSSSRAADGAQRLIHAAEKRPRGGGRRGDGLARARAPHAVGEGTDANATRRRVA